MKSLPKIIFYFIVIGIIFNAIKTYLFQRDLEFITFEEVFGWYFKFSFYGNVLISMASVLSFLIYRKNFPVYAGFCYVSLVGLVTLASLNDFAEIMKTPTALYSTKGIGTFVNFGLLFFAANRYYLEKILKLFYYLCFVFIVGGIINLGGVGFGSGRQQYLYAIRDLTVYLIWVFPFFLLQDEPDKKKNVLNFIVFLIIFLFVLSTGSRSYLVIYALFFIAKFKNQLQGKNFILTVTGMVLLLVGAYFVLINTGLGPTIEGAFDILSERSSEDSRSGQLVEFVEQIDYDYLLQGVGPMKKWYWSVIGHYPFLDNQFLLLGWWAGLPTLLVYMYLLVRSFLRKNADMVSENVKGLKLIICLWIMACLGLAIYVTISSDLYYYFISLLMGLQLCKVKEIYPSEFD